MNGFKPIPGFDGYLVNDRGDVYSTKRSKILTALPSYGYLRVGMMVDGRQINRKVHILVCAAFLGPRPDGMVCAHLDGNQTNNHVSNLAYVTHKENMAHRKLHGTYYDGERTANCKLTREKVIQIRREYSPAVGSGLTVLGRKYGVSKSTIYNIVRGITWKGAGDDEVALSVAPIRAATIAAIAPDMLALLKDFAHPATSSELLRAQAFRLIAKAEGRE